MKKILLVEDEVDLADVMTELLQSHGFSVVVKYNGLDAKQVIDSGEQFDLIITDNNMPKMTGQQLGKYLHGIGSNIPRLCFSSDVGFSHLDTSVFHHAIAKGSIGELNNYLKQFRTAA